VILIWSKQMFQVQMCISPRGVEKWMHATPTKYSFLQKSGSDCVYCLQETWLQVISIITSSLDCIQRTGSKQQTSSKVLNWRHDDGTHTHRGRDRERGILRERVGIERERERERENMWYDMNRQAGVLGNERPDHLASVAPVGGYMSMNRSVILNVVKHVHRDI
jgi:hypothetical protein